MDEKMNGFENVRYFFLLVEQLLREFSDILEALQKMFLKISRSKKFFYMLQCFLRHFLEP